ncbi:KAP family P-loop NTPase fold protein [Halorubrum lipolyticum]|uniref:KAP NTPase domain-containing protein n=1 Tax=Halorubrum lipolyticum DSM 21995 TaxID=1227482 RepID=M0P571_9EURY|nr:P-loop NTPase fold protein [Halorubrum lipolyticum]EMA64679.1 hypothetical protein C469_00445 [Halorubrum lipolyticum DSM 21995]
MSDDSDDDSFPKFGLNSDTSSYEDYLGFEPYVIAVKEFITSGQTKPPLTISIEGDWGSGKTTFLNLLEESLGDEYTSVRFNPWRHEDKEAVWATFALQLVRALKQDANLCERAKFSLQLAWRRYISNTTWWERTKSVAVGISLATPLLVFTALWVHFGWELTFSYLNLSDGPMGIINYTFGTGGFIAVVVGYLEFINRLGIGVGSSIEKNLVAYAADPNYNKKSEFITEFQQDFSDILDIYLEEGERVFVFIDDLDRCSVPRAADLMEAINLLLSDDDQMVFIMGLDRERVAAGVAAKHSEVLSYLDQNQANGDLDYGYQYLEKFIQIPFLVPEPKEEDIENLIRSVNNRESIDESHMTKQWNDIESELEGNLNEIFNMAAPALQGNPRQVKRFGNLFQLRAILAHTEDVLVINDVEDVPDTITLFQLAKFVIISIQWPQLITKIYNDIDALDTLIEVASNDNKVAPADLERWANDRELLELLTYQNDDSRYDIRNKQIGTLLKISPRADRPTKSDSTDNSIARKIDISIFSSNQNRGQLENIFAQIMRDYSEVEIDILPDYYDINSNEKSVLSRAFHGPIWIVEEQIATQPAFKEIVESVPDSSLIIVLERDNLLSIEEIENIANSLPCKNSIAVSSEGELADILSNRIDSLVQNQSEWENWRKEATAARNDYVHGF